MSNPLNALTSLLHRLGVVGPARVCVFQGTGASKIGQKNGAPSSRRAAVTLAALTTMLGALAFTAAPALAAAPEAPVTSTPAKSITATTAILEGTLNPGASATAGWYFAYSTEISCALGATTPLEAEVTGKAVKEQIEVTGLEPSRKYTFCLVATNEGGAAATPGNEVVFETKALPPEVIPSTESASAVNAKGATLSAEVNANNQKTTYAFDYSTTEAAGKLTGTITTVNGASPIQPNEFGGRGVSVPTGAVLTPGTTYFYRALATNAKAEKAEGEVKSFTTVPTPTTDTPTPVGTTTATLDAHLQPLNETVPTKYHFDYKAGGECTGGTETAEGEAGTGAGTEVAETAEITELLPDGEYTVCFVTVSEFGSEQSPPVHFTTLPIKASIDSEAATAITASSATLTAQINPNGSQTTYHFDYGTTAAYGASTPDAHTGSGRTAVAASASIPLQAANTTYHWRLTATNAAGTTTTTDQTFVDDTTGGALPDARQYEMVTPPEKNGALIDAFFGNGGTPIVPQIAPDGKSMIAVSIQCFDGTPSCIPVRQQEGEPYEFTRTPSGWATRPLAPPATQFAVNSVWAVNAEQHDVLFSGPTPPSGGDDFYSRNASGEITDIGPIGEGPEGTTPESGASFSKLRNIVATSDLSHVVFAGISLWSLSGHPEVENSLYQYSGAHNAAPRPVGVTGGPTSTSLISECGTDLGAGEGAGLSTNSFGSLSADGGKVYFTAVGHTNPSCPGTLSAPPVEELFARVDGEELDAQTVAISEPSAFSVAAPYPGCSEEPCIKSVNEQANWRDAVFVGASGDGARVYFRSTQQLTDGAVEGNDNLYLYDSLQPQGRRLVDVSAGSATPEVQGAMAISSDGSHVYFVARGALTNVQENQNHETAEQGKDNLYVSAEGQPTRFVATLPESDEATFSGALEWGQGIGLANVTADGRFLVFLSHGALTPDDTRPGGPAQVYRYDAQAEALVRISIGQHGFNNNGNAGIGESGIVVAASGFGVGVGPGRADPTMSHDGSYVFFQSPNALAPGALEDVEVGSGHLAQNVYEYHDGLVSLISDGKDNTPQNAVLENTVELLGSDASGSNVFFATNDQLTSQDTDTQRDYYDARICTSAEPCFTPPAPAQPCGEQSCHPATPAPGAGQTPGSESFNGPGNLTPPPAAPAARAKPLTRAQKLARALKACHRDRRRAKRVKCQRRARKLYAKAAQAHRSSTAKNVNHRRRSR